MSSLKYLDSITVDPSQVDNLFRILLNHMYVLSRRSAVAYKLAFDPEFQLLHSQITEENLFLQIEQQVGDLGRHIQSKRPEAFQVVFQLFRVDPSMKQSYISNLFKFKGSKKQVLQEFFLHVSVNAEPRDSSRFRSAVKTELTRKLAVLLKHINKNRGQLGRDDEVGVHAYFVNNFKQ